MKISTSAMKDLAEISAYISEHDSPDSALHVLTNLVDTIAKLSTLPGRGNIPPECRMLGNEIFREVFFKPYRIFYEVRGAEVYILWVVDGRRDVDLLKHKRLLDE